MVETRRSSKASSKPSPPSKSNCSKAKDEVAKIRATPKLGKLEVYELDMEDVHFLIENKASFLPLSHDTDQLLRMHYDHVIKKDVG